MVDPQAAAGPQRLQQGGAVHGAMHGTAPNGYIMMDYGAPGQSVGQAPLGSQSVALHGQWRDQLCDCCVGVDGPSSCLMACAPICFPFCFPVCIPCLFGKISSRISWQAPFLRGWGNTTFVQWLRFLTVFTVMFILFSFNYTVFQSLAQDEYLNDIRKSPYYHYDDQTWHGVEPSYRTKELRMYASLFDVLTLMMTVVLIVLLAILRKRVRERFLIPSMCERRAGESPVCGTLEDVVCMVCCQACALAQIARHTLALVGDRCDPYSDPGPIEMFPAAHTQAPGLVNSMHQNQTLPPLSQAYVPQAVVSDNNSAPAQGRPVEVGHLVQDTFPAPAASSGSVPTARITDDAAVGQVQVPVAAHASATEGQHGVSRHAART